jgi:dsRNA-specific ribonuclease
MCSNEQLKVACERINFNYFILTAKLARGQWIPSPLELYFPTTGKIQESENAQASGKTCADCIEAILGFVYRRQGYKATLQVADELLLTIPWDDNDIVNQTEQLSPVTKRQLTRKAEDFTGYHSF